jgi:hypothetical protein
MKTLVILFQLLCFYLYLPAVELAPDSISTVYKDGEFVTHYKTKFNATNKVVGDVSENLVTDFHNSPANLFNWALKDLGLQEKKENELTFIIKPSQFDEKTGITHGLFDIIVPNITTFKNVKIDAIVAKKTRKSGETEVIADIIYSSLLLKNGLGTIIIIPQKNNEQLLIANVRIRFGWFFNIFITKKRYKSIIEWRIKKFSENIKKECEKRQEKTSD